MTIFDLIFALAFLFTLLMVISTLVAAIRRKRRNAFVFLGVLATLDLVYLGALLAMSVTDKGQVLKPGEFLWSDDWGIAAVSASTEPPTSAATHIVTLTITSRAGRIAQRENGVQLFVTDDSGARYESVSELSSGQTDALLQPHEAITLTRAFKLPSDAKNARLIISRGLSFPGILIIGGDDSLLHERPSVRLADLPKP